MRTGSLKLQLRIDGRPKHSQMELEVWDQPSSAFVTLLESKSLGTRIATKTLPRMKLESNPWVTSQVGLLKDIKGGQTTFEKMSRTSQVAFHTSKGCP